MGEYKGVGGVEEWEDEGEEYNSRIWEQFPELYLGGKKAHFGCENSKINKDSS